MTHATPEPPIPERVMVRAALPLGAALAAIAVPTALLLRGPAGALTALGGVALLVVWFAVSGWSLAWAAARGLAVLQAVALGGFAVRLGLLGVLLLVLEPVARLDGPVLAVTVSVGMVALLVHEVRSVLGRPELWWLRQGKERA